VSGHAEIIRFLSKVDLEAEIGTEDEAEQEG
jgi:hypothetical protein